MADSNRNLIPLSQSDFDVAEGDVDPRGWDVYSSDGRKVGEVEELIGDTSSRKVRFLDCDLDEKELGLKDDRHALIPVTSVRLDQGKKQVFLQNLSSTEVLALPATVSDITPEHGQRFETAWAEREARLTRSEEELEVTKREIETGDVELTKRVETEHVTRPVTRTHEEVEVERRPAHGMQAGEAEFREEKLRVPIHDEEIEVRKRPEVKEEVIVKTHPVTEEEDVEADLRKERIDVEKHGNVEERSRTDERGRLDRGQGR
jgi:uncharacterized protein (TIGR02271 family)